MEGSGLSRVTFNRLRFFFRHKLHLDTEYIIQSRINFLSGIKPKLYDMCLNSCCLFAGDRAKITHCDFCTEPRYCEDGTTPRCQFSYFPFAEHIKVWFENPDMVEQMQYRADYEHIPGEIRDIFDGMHYQSLYGKYVVLDGEKLRHKYFSGQHDVVLGISTDGFQVCN